MIKIVTDTSSNFTPEEAEKLGIIMTPLSISFGGKEYVDAFEITADEFYDKLESSVELPRSSQVNITQFESVFRDAEKSGDTLLVLLISSALSGTYASAIAAKENVGYANVHIYDSCATTIMLKLLVLEAVKNADKPIAELISYIDGLRARTEIFAIVDTLEYLHRGGRLKKSAAIVGKLLHIKPIITITPVGSLEVVGKAVGTKSACRNIKKMVDINEIDMSHPVLFVYSKHRDRCKMLISELYPDNTDGLEDASNLCPVVGVHVGPGAAGICYVRK